MCLKLIRLIQRVSVTLCFCVLLGCTVHAPNLPTEDHLLRFAVKGKYVIAESERYAYSFFNNAPQEYDRYASFIARYKNSARGVYVIFNVDNHDIDATYNIIIDISQVAAVMIADLKNSYNAQPAEDNNQLIVTFHARGRYAQLSNNNRIDSHRASLSEADNLAYPIAVTINDKTETLSPLSAIIIVPLFPVIMMYGCAIGPC